MPLIAGVEIPCLWSHDGNFYMAEILDVRDFDGEQKFYVHYKDFNKRLDEWVSLDKLNRDYAVVFAEDILKKIEKLKKQATRTNHKRKTDEGTTDPAPKKVHEGRVKNVETVYFGKYEISAWYYSPYPDEYTADKTLWLCEFCLKYHKSETSFRRHKQKCKAWHPPGDEIYRSGNLSFFEVDGRKNRVYCQDLCLLSKLFLDHKTLYYDVEPFLFYVLTENDETGCHMVGYFSKEKDSADEFNLACILTMPQHQRKGYGRLLISFSYELSKIEGKVGTPEKPLSDLGLLSYRSYWAQAIVEELKRVEEISIKDISQRTSIKVEDVMQTLQHLDLIKYLKGSHVLNLTSKVLAEHDKMVSKQQVSINPKLIHWTPMPQAKKATK